jgi:hypothetical protein
MNTLSKEDSLLFHKLMDSLLLFVNQKTGIIKNATNMKELHQKEIEKTKLLREKIFSDKYDFIDNFVKENPFNFSTVNLGIIQSWKKYIKGKFFVVKHTPEHSLFFDSQSNKMYGVKGITDSFEEKFEGYAPVLLEITLIPFRDSIIYDGIFFPYNISFGSGIAKSLKAETDESIQKFGIITSLIQPMKKKENNEKELLRFYMKSIDNKLRYETEINHLRKKSKDLEAVYYQEEARNFSRHPKKMLKEFGMKGHFAVMFHSVIASGSTKKELQNNIVKIVPPEKRTWIHTFNL